MHKITNRTNSPFDLQTTTGRVFLPAMGEVAGMFDAAYLEILALAGNVKVEPVEQPKRRGRPPKNKEPEHG